MHPEATQSSKTEEHKAPVNPKGNTINSTPQRSDNEITKQVVDHLKSIPGIRVLGRSAMAEFLKTHNPKYLQQYIAKSTLPKGELSVLSSALMTKYGNNTSYGDVIQTANYEYTVNYKGAGEFDIIEYHQIDNNLNKVIDDTERERVPEALNRMSTRNEFAQRQYKSNSFHVEDREANGDNAGLDKSTSQGKSNQTSNNDGSSQHQEWSEIKRDSATGRITFVDSDGRTVSSIEDWKDIETFTTPQGEVYGFVDKDGNIYLDETKISPEHPIHEYTHLWDRAVQKHNPKLWDRGVELMKQTSLWNDVANDEHYGKQWQSMNLPKEKLENLIASEVHSRIVGENGEKLLTNIAKRKGQSGIIAKLKQWVLDMWKDVKATFGSWSKEDLDALTLNDFNHMTVRDFVDSVNLKDATNASYTEQQSKELKTVDEVWENLGGYFEGAGLNINKDFPNASEKDISTLEDNYMAPDRYPLTDSQIIEIGNRIINSNTTNNGTEEYKTTDEFRRVQEASRKLSEKGVSSFQRGERKLDGKDKERIGRLLGRLLESNSNGSWHGVQSHLTHVNKDNSTGSFNVGRVDGKLFHDIFEIVRTYLPNGELVDLHEDYSDCKCFVTDDGLCGFAIEPNGNLVSVFSLSPTTNKGFLYAIKEMVREEGATHLDAYMSNKQPLQEIYKKTLGFYPASIMDYNMDYDQNDIAKNHNMPQVVFMVDHEVADVKHFDKDSYIEAQQYQLDQLKKPDANNTETEEDSTQMVELPGYELSKGLPDAVPVDAEWKIYYLKKLDAQLSMEKHYA